MNTVSSFKELHQKKKKQTNNNPDNNEAGALQKMLLSIDLEIQAMKPDSLLLNVDPEIEAIEEIEKIQNYCNLIQKEIFQIV